MSIPSSSIGAGSPSWVGLIGADRYELLLCLESPRAVVTSSELLVLLLIPSASFNFSSSICCDCSTPPPKAWKLSNMELWTTSCCFLLDWATLDEDALDGRERGRDGWSSTPALLYTRHNDISAWKESGRKEGRKGGVGDESCNFSSDVSCNFSKNKWLLDSVVFNSW